MSTKLTDKEWEELCDGCGKCCGSDYGKFGRGPACPGLNCATNRCKVYEKRFTTYMCTEVTPENTLDLYARGILPDSCAYVRHEKGLPPLDRPVEEATLIPFKLMDNKYQREYDVRNKKYLSERRSRSPCETGHR